MNICPCLNRCDSFGFTCCRGDRISHDVLISKFAFGGDYSRMVATTTGFTSHVGMIPYKYLICMMMSRCFKAFICLKHQGPCFILVHGDLPEICHQPNTLLHSQTQLGFFQALFLEPHRISRFLAGFTLQSDNRKLNTENTPFSPRRFPKEKPQRNQPNRFPGVSTVENRQEVMSPLTCINSNFENRWSCGVLDFGRSVAQSCFFS